MPVIIIIIIIIITTILEADACYYGPCLNGGACTPVDESFTCDCLSMYSGETCEIGTSPKC